jgi:hypothetical protein
LKFKVQKRSKYKIFLLSLIIIGLITSLPLVISANLETLDSEEKFSIIVLPDTQHYSDKFPWIFENQTQWILENKESLNIVFVTHLGDLVDDPESIEEWENANTSMSKLDGEIPYGVLPGNHDGAHFGGDLSNYNKYFSYERFKSQIWYGGAYQNINTNNYQMFSAGKEEFLIFHLQMIPSDDVLLWAGSVIDDYPNRKVIVSTHDYVDGYDSNSRSRIGDKIWEKLVKPHADQVFLVLCGHWENEIRITSLEDGYFVHQLLSDYQDREEGGNGWLRIIEFNPKTDEILVKTFSPYLNKFETDSNSQFVLDDQITYYNILFPFYRFLPLIIIISSITIVVIFFTKRRSRKTKIKI